MKFKHFTMEELKEMTQDQQRGYLICELMLGACNALIEDVSKKGIYEAAPEQLIEVLHIEDCFRRVISLLKEAMTADTERLEEMLVMAVRAPKVLNYK